MFVMYFHCSSAILPFRKNKIKIIISFRYSAILQFCNPIILQIIKHITWFNVVPRFRSSTMKMHGKHMYLIVIYTIHMYI